MSDTTNETTPGLHMTDDDIWAAIDDQRRRTADMLDTLTDEQWAHASLCDGWTVRDVGAHLTMQQLTVGDFVSLAARHASVMAIDINKTINRAARIRATELTAAETSARIRAMIGSRKHNVGVTQLETLTDCLVHGQDIAIPLGLPLEMDPEAAAAAATRAWQCRGTWLSRVFRPLPLDGLRLTAIDTEWSVGAGPEVAGPMAALLLLLAGRTVRLDELTGAGAATLRDA